ncbi:MAG: DUF4097 domain-containing protein [Roseburia sp.]|nr:DUF4097 domain-containing protein [Roseburia sp.]
MDFQSIKDIAIYGTDCIVDISRGDDETTRIISAREKYFDFKLENGQLTVTQKSRNVFYRIILRRFELKVVLPKNFKGKLRFRNKNGGIYVKNCDFTDIEVSTRNGKFEMENITANEIELEMSNGSIAVKNIRMSGEAYVRCKNGNIRAESMTAGELSLSGANAGISAIDIQSAKFECSTSNGAIDASAIACENIRLKTSNGKINALPLGARDDYRLAVETAHGSITVDGVPYKNISDAAGAKKRLYAKTSNGEIDIKFM